MSAIVEALTEFQNSARDYITGDEKGEDVIASHPGVARVAVIGLPDPKWGEAVTAVIVGNGTCELTPEELVALVRTEKGPVQAPKRLIFVDAIPLSPVGKPDKKALRAQFAPAPTA